MNWGAWGIGSKRVGGKYPKKRTLPRFSLGWFALAALLNVGMFGWMRNLVVVPQVEPQPEMQTQALQLIELEKLPEPEVPKPEKARAKPDMKALSVPASMPQMAQPQMALSPARASQGLATPVLTPPSLGPVSVKGRMVTGPAPGLAAGVGHGAGRAMQGVRKAAPQPTLRVPPRYPPAALREGIEGWVKLRFVIDRRGRPTQVQVQGSQPEDVFDRAALRAVRKWSYPKQSDPTPATVTLEFKMQEGQ